MRDEDSNVYYAFEHFSNLQKLRNEVSLLLAKVESLSLDDYHQEQMVLTVNSIHQRINDRGLHLMSPEDYKNHMGGILVQFLDLDISSALYNPIKISEMRNLADKLSDFNNTAKFNSVMYYMKFIHLLDVYSDFNITELKDSFYSTYSDVVNKSESIGGFLKSIEEAVEKVESAKIKGLKQINSASIAVVDAATTEIGYEISREFRETAHNEMTQAVYYRRGALFCFFCSALVLIINAFYGSAPIDFAELIYKAGPVLFFTIPAFYLARESASHRADYRKYKQLALNLPIGIRYIDALDDGSRHIVQAEFAKHLLMNNDYQPTNQNADNKSVSEQIDKLSTILSDFKSAVEKISKT